MRVNFLLVVVIIAALIASGFFIINYFKESTTVEELEEQIATSNQDILELTSSREKWLEEIDDLKENQAIMQNVVLAGNSNVNLITDSNEVIRNIMELGQRNGTDVIPLSNSGWVNVKIQQGNYKLLNLTITIEGSEYSIINFIKGLQNLYPTLIIESLRISTLTTTNSSNSGVDNQIVNDERIHSNLSVAIYSR